MAILWTKVHVWVCWSGVHRPLAIWCNLDKERKRKKRKEKKPRWNLWSCATDPWFTKNPSTWQQVVAMLIIPWQSGTKHENPSLHSCWFICQPNGRHDGAYVTSSDVPSLKIALFSYNPHFNQMLLWHDGISLLHHCWQAQLLVCHSNVFPFYPDLGAAFHTRGTSTCWKGPHEWPHGDGLMAMVRVWGFFGSVLCVNKIHNASPVHEKRAKKNTKSRSSCF